MAYDFTLAPGRAALLVVDLQRGFCDRPVSDELGFGSRSTDHFWYRLDDLVLPNAQRLIAAARAAGVEVIYTVIEALTLDGRDRGLDHKRSDFLIPKGSDGGQVMPQIAPEGDEIVLSKTASGLFGVTNIDYVLRNLGVERLCIFGVFSHQCVEAAVRGAADHGYLVTLVPDACAATTEEQEAATADGMKAFARVAGTEEVLKELRAAEASGGASVA